MPIEEIWYEDKDGTIGLNVAAKNGNETVGVSYGNGMTNDKNVAKFEALVGLFVRILEPKPAGLKRAKDIVAKARAAANRAGCDLVRDTNVAPRGESASRLQRRLDALEDGAGGDVDPFA